MRMAEVWMMSVVMSGFDTCRQVCGCDRPSLTSIGDKYA